MFTPAAYYDRPVTQLPAAFLTLPAPGDTRFASIERKVRLLALRQLLRSTERHPALYEALFAATRADKAVLPGLLASPDLLTPLLCLEAGLIPREQALASVVPGLLAALVQRGLLPHALIWERPVELLVLGTQAWRFQPPARALAAFPGGVELDLGEAGRLPLDTLPATQPFSPLVPGLHLSTLDSNPLAMTEAHPDKQGNALDLGGRSESDWVAALQQALALVQQALPEWWAELGPSLRRIVPVGYQPELHLSASYREAPGLAYLTLHPSPITMAEAIVHEAQHSRLNCLLWLDAVLENGWTDWTDSPVRPDLRPLMGVLLAVHAFVPVAALHARLAEAGHPLAQGPDFARRRLQVLSGNARGLAIVQERARATALGRILVDELARLHQALVARVPTALQSDVLPPG